jgi:hypothetical protein
VKKASKAPKALYDPWYTPVSHHSHWIINFIRTRKLDYPTRKIRIIAHGTLLPSVMTYCADEIVYNGEIIKSRDGRYGKYEA